MDGSELPQIYRKSAVNAAFVTALLGVNVLCLINDDVFACRQRRKHSTAASSSNSDSLLTAALIKHISTRMPVMIIIKHGYSITF